MYNAGSNLLIITIKSMENFMSKAGKNLFIIFYFYHAAGNSKDLSTYRAGTNLLIILCFYHATGKSMEISMYKAGTNLLIILYFCLLYTSDAADE